MNELLIVYIQMLKTCCDAVHVSLLVRARDLEILAPLEGYGAVIEHTQGPLGMVNSQNLYSK